MALATTRSIALLGIEGSVVDVEADLADGLPAFYLLGLPDAALGESRDRVRAAILNSGESWPSRRITVALSPASLPKRGSSYDIAVAVAILAADSKVPSKDLPSLMLMGELALDGRIKEVRGVLPAVLAATKAGIYRAIVPAANVAEARLVPGVEVMGFRSLVGLIAWFRGVEPPDELPNQEPLAISVTKQLDLVDVVGQHEAKRAAEISAVGEHHLFMVGTPGSGKTMIAERLPSILPPLDSERAIEVSAIHSIAGLLPEQEPLLTSPPFIAPHHTASRSAIIGGGSAHPKPGAVSLAHGGVLFMDEAPEFTRGILDALRQPLESGFVSVSRTAGTARYPARFLLALAANPCPCGKFSGDGRACTCSSLMVRRYLSRLSGPLLDRVDLQVYVEPVSRVDLMGNISGESSDLVRDRVMAARERSIRRLEIGGWRTNSQIGASSLRGAMSADSAGMALVHRALDDHRLTARGLHKVLRLAWSVADLEGHDRPTIDDVAQGYALRTGAQRLVGAA
ncbi:MAG TPA: YifB family Mg chelatase-like AAA ATPase [Candidatus Nanopelagicaceae bacterium]|nr:YifB family Mg chelatase-like AAA ATPase [Candidatus Nanopelagicaceae bacterium]